jgi:hypothetical protein
MKLLLLFPLIVEWKNLQTRAGKAVLQVSKLKAKPKVYFGDLDLDI